jgi:hypothetical protein
MHNALTSHPSQHKGKKEFSASNHSFKILSLSLTNAHQPFPYPNKLQEKALQYNQGKTKSYPSISLLPEPQKKRRNAAIFFCVGFLTTKASQLSIVQRIRSNKYAFRRKGIVEAQIAES